ncbi:MAG: hypothetical protein M1840_004389 [Geoglossum simile]|nr:MAG: hypothetical protein M1840_004389 [Geoglossum simile]
MPPAKRRRVTKANKPSSPVLTTRSLFPFAKTTKAQVASNPNTQKHVFSAETEPIRVTTNASSQSKSAGSSKRKLVEVGDGETKDAPVLAPQVTNQKKARETNKSLGPHIQEQKAARSDFKRFFSASPGLPPEAAHLAPSPRVSASPASTLGYRHEQLPDALQDLINLHSSFSAALSLHHAHNGALMPADLRHLTPSIGRTWGRRTVTTDDIRRTLGILQHKPTAHNINTLESSKYGLKLLDYGNGKICVEISHDSKLYLAPNNPLDVDDLNTLFAENLHGYWKFWVSTTDEENIARQKATLSAMNDADKETSFNETNYISPELISIFIQHLPMATIDVCSSLNRMSPLLSKGRKRLEEFKCAASFAKRNQCREVRAKELHKSTLPLPLSKAAMHRKSALQRLDEVISVLTHLSTSGTGSPRVERGKGPTIMELQTSTGYSSTSASLSSIFSQQRISLPLATLILHLKNSLTSPISREEAEKCIQLLVDEVAPDWINTVTLGEVTAVIINKSARAGVSGWKDRVEM